MQGRSDLETIWKVMKTMERMAQAAKRTALLSKMKMKEKTQRHTSKMSRI